MCVIGPDVHRNFAQVAILDSGVVKDHGRFAMDRSPVLVFAKTLTRKDDVIANPLQVRAIPASPQEAFHPQKDDVARRSGTQNKRPSAAGLFGAPRVDILVSPPLATRFITHHVIQVTPASHDADNHSASNRTLPFATTVASMFADLTSGIHDTWSHNGLWRSIGSSRDGSAGFTDSTFQRGLSRPTAMDFAPDGRLFVLQQTGQVRVIKKRRVVINFFRQFYG